MPAAFDERNRVEAVQAVRTVKQALFDAEVAHTAAVSRRAELTGRLQSSMAHLAEGSAVAAAVAHLETEHALWTALAKALGNDGWTAR